MRIFLIRHGAPSAAWGEADDPGLSDLGRDQAAGAAARLAELGSLQIVSSPMRRCQETAAPFVALRKAGVTLEPRVSEVVTPTGGLDRRAWLAATFPWRPGVAPTLWSDMDAVFRAWRDDAVAAVRACTADTAIFTHFIAINAIVGAVLGRAETIVFRPDFASITALNLDGDGLHVVSLGAEMDGGEVR